MQLLNALAEAAEAAGYYKLTSRVFTTNHASLALHRAAGFTEVGVQRATAGSTASGKTVSWLMPARPGPHLMVTGFSSAWRARRADGRGDAVVVQDASGDRIALLCKSEDDVSGGQGPVALCGVSPSVLEGLLEIGRDAE